jgi:hypothetical protein
MVKLQEREAEYSPPSPTSFNEWSYASSPPYVFMALYLVKHRTYLPWPYLLESRDRSVGIATGYGLDDPGSTVRFPAGAGNFCLQHRIQNGSGAHPASYPMGNRDSFTGGKSARM